MGVSKDWLNEKMKEELISLENNDDKYTKGRYDAFQECFLKLTEAPKPKNEPKSKDFDVDKTFEDIVKYYVDKKGYTIEHANEIAQKVVAEQKQKRLG